MTINNRADTFNVIVFNIFTMKQMIYGDFIIWIFLLYFKKSNAVDSDVFYTEMKRWEV